MDLTIKNIKKPNEEWYMPQLYKRLNTAILQRNIQSVIKLSKIITKCHIRDA